MSLDPDGTRGYGDLRRNAYRASAYGIEFQVAALEDVIRSKEAANRERDRAVLHDLRRTLELRRVRESGER